MQDLKDVTNNALYENYRCQKLAGVVSSPDPKNVQQAPSRCVWVWVCMGGWVVYMCMCVVVCVVHACVGGCVPCDIWYTHEYISSSIHYTSM